MGKGSEVETLESYVEKMKKEGLFKALKTLYAQVAEGVIGLEDPSPPRSFLEYLTRMDYSMWFYTVIAIVLVTLICIHIPIEFLKPFRWFSGTLFTLFIPGYVTVEALYPDEKALKPLERVALSIGLSLAVTPLLGLLLNYTPWGIRLEPVVTTLTLYSLALLVTAGYRKYALLKLAISVKNRRRWQHSFALQA
jgi:uncharacterized membrane protein